METELANNLAVLVARYSSARGLTESTIGKLCAADGRFFSRIREGKTFTVRKYDELLHWFSENWPAEVQWPERVERPDRRAIQEAAE